MRRRQSYRAGLRCSYLVFVAIVFLRDGSAATPPADFSLRAAFFPGAGLADYENSKPWRLRIRPDGKAVQEISVIGSHSGVRRVVKSFRLSQEDLRELSAIVQEANFFGLPDHISNSEFDHFAGCVLEITMGGRTRRVEFVWPTDEKATHKRRALTRFWKVWRTVLKRAPSPNGDSEAVWWLQRARPDLVAQTR
jgi:hypothetical protein